MITFDLTKDEQAKILEFTKSLPEKFGGEKPGNLEQKFLGFCGEYAIRKYFGMKPDLKDQPDGGFDMRYKNLWVGIKTTTEFTKKEDFVFYPERQTKQKANFYIWLERVMNKDESATFRVMTAMFKRDFLEISFYQKAGEPLHIAGGVVLYKPTDPNNKVVYPAYVALIKYMNKIETKADLMNLLKLSNDYFLD